MLLYSDSFLVFQSVKFRISHTFLEGGRNISFSGAHTCDIDLQTYILGIISEAVVGSRRDLPAEKIFASFAYRTSLKCAAERGKL